jgi:hypothetical protein
MNRSYRHWFGLGFALLVACNGASDLAGSGRTREKDDADKHRGGKSPSSDVDGAGHRDDEDEDDDDDAHDEDSADATAEGEESESGGTATARYDLAKKVGRADIVWVIDNSSSMSNEIGYVEANLERFLASMEQRTDVKVAVLSAQSGGSAAVLPVQVPASIGSVAITKLDSDVSSVDALDQLAAATCPTDTTVLDYQGTRAPRAITKLCGSAMENTARMRNVRPNIARVLGALHDFYRTGSRRTFVIVTDDDARISGPAFSQMMTNVSFADYSLYAFAGLGGGCSTTKTGSVYIDIANRTEGKVFDICETDWSAYFDDLAKQIMMAARTRFQLPKGAGEVIKVTVDGERVDDGKFEIQGRTVRFKKGALDPDATTLKITYHH